MSSFTVVYIGPRENRMGLLRGAAYNIIIDSISPGLMFKCLVVYPTNLFGEPVGGPLYYWNKEDLNRNWMILDKYDEDMERIINQKER